jgi:hypothetical protein
VALSVVNGGVIGVWVVIIVIFFLAQLGFQSHETACSSNTEQAITLRFSPGFQSVFYFHFDFALQYPGRTSATLPDTATGGDLDAVALRDQEQGV